jgi:hypothetical protein
MHCAPSDKVKETKENIKKMLQGMRATEADIDVAADNDIELM